MATMADNVQSTVTVLKFREHIKLISVAFVSFYTFEDKYEMYLSPCLPAKSSGNRLSGKLERNRNTMWTVLLYPTHLHFSNSKLKEKGVSINFIQVLPILTQYTANLALTYAKSFMSFISPYGILKCVFHVNVRWFDSLDWSYFQMGKRIFFLFLRYSAVSIWCLSVYLGYMHKISCAVIHQYNQSVSLNCLIKVFERVMGTYCTMSSILYKASAAIAAISTTKL